MTINISNIKPETVKGLEVDFGTSVAASIWRKIINNHTWVERSLPIGAIIFFYESITEADGTPKDPPNPNIWKFMDGSVVNDSDSPLDGQSIPNTLDLFPKGSDTQGLTGGSYTININHSHGGQTGDTDDTAGVVVDLGSDHNTGSIHHHSLDNKWSTVEPIIPMYTAVQGYIRYK